MATPSQVKTAFDDIAALMAKQRARIDSFKSGAAEVSSALAAIPTDFADVISTVQGYTPTGAFETLAKDELAKITTEFQALKAEADEIAGE